MGAKQLPEAIAYVCKQKEHHQRGNLMALLERDDDEDDGPVIWNGGAAIQGIRVIKP